MTGETLAGFIQRIGRYFSLVSLTPGLILVIGIHLLFSATSGIDGVDLNRAIRSIANQDLSGWIATVMAATVFGLLSHPLQYAMTQVFEGYWGAGGVGGSLASSAVQRHRHRAAHFESIADESEDLWVRVAHHSRPRSFRMKYRGPKHAGIRRQLALERLHEPSLDFVIPTYLAEQSSRKALDRYPENHGRIMPTRLGNILRSHEDSIGQAYGLDLVTIMPYISQTARSQDVSRVDDEGEQMDLAIRLSMVFALLTVISLTLLAGRGLWIGITLVPYLASYVSYRGACVAAENYMTAIGVLVHLNRASLYEALCLGKPKSFGEEQLIAGHAMDLLSELELDDAVPYSYVADGGQESDGEV